MVLVKYNKVFSNSKCSYLFLFFPWVDNYVLQTLWLTYYSSLFTHRYAYAGYRVWDCHACLRQARNDEIGCSNRACHCRDSFQHVPQWQRAKAICTKKPSTRETSHFSAIVRNPLFCHCEERSDAAVSSTYSHIFIFFSSYTKIQKLWTINFIILYDNTGKIKKMQ